MLAQRLGLIPLTGNQESLNWIGYQPKKDPSEDETGEASDANDTNTVVLKLDVVCEKADSPEDRRSADSKIAYKNAHVYAKQITFHPAGRQEELFSEANGPIRAVNPDILIAKMRPGQEIHLEMHAIKGIGMDHAKFSPVATATYRLLPRIDILKPIFGKDAEKFRKCFMPGVIGLKKVTKQEAEQEGSGYEGHEGEVKAVVRNAMGDSVSREVLRHEEFQGKVKLGRVRDHFIFSVESTGQFESDFLFLESVRCLKHKCIRLKRSLQAFQH